MTLFAYTTILRSKEFIKLANLFNKSANELKELLNCFNDDDEFIKSNLAITLDSKTIDSEKSNDGKIEIVKKTYIFPEATEFRICTEGPIDIPLIENNEIKISTDKNIIYEYDPNNLEVETIKWGNSFNISSFIQYPSAES